MIFRLVSILLLVGSTAASADKPNLKARDFRPLTTLPWEEFEEDEVSEIVGQIYLEPDWAIRHIVLDLYFAEAPVEQLAKAFDEAIAHCHDQSPNDLVHALMRLWAGRDPAGAWKKTEELFGAVGIEDGWLNYDTWPRYRPPITVQDHAAIQASPIWLRRTALLGFPAGVEESDWTRSDRLPLLKSFADRWFEEFETWPVDDRNQNWREGSLASENPWEVTRAFRQKDTRSEARFRGSKESGSAFEVRMRRWLVKAPEDALEIVEHIRAQTWPQNSDAESPKTPGRVKPSFLLLWAQTDLEGLKTWVATDPNPVPKTAWIAKCILMPSVEARQREQWLSEIADGKESDDLLVELMCWEPALAVSLARELLSDDDWFSRVFGRLGWTEFGHNPEGLEVALALNIEQLLAKRGDYALQDAGTRLMETWGDVAIGECAQFGMRCLALSESVNTDELIDLFRGSNEFSSDGDLIDRTFCSLRTWAVVRPDEFREWIPTVEGRELEDALTWLLENPWGTDE